MISQATTARTFNWHASKASAWQYEKAESSADTTSEGCAGGTLYYYCTCSFLLYLYRDSLSLLLGFDDKISRSPQVRRPGFKNGRANSPASHTAECPPVIYEKLLRCAQLEHSLAMCE